MIKRLEVKDYGKFAKAHWDFGAFTVVAGPNEAGKTTVFDALFDALCADSRKENLKPWKRLAGRYTAIRQANITWKGEPLAFNFDEFLEIFAIRAGDGDIHTAEGGTWAGMAQAKLLNAGLNPAEIAEALARKAKTRAAGGLQARITELNAQLSRKLPELDTLKAERDRIFSGEAETRRLEAELKAKNGELEAKKAEAHAANVKFEEISLACRLASAEAGIKALRELKAAREELAGLARFSGSEVNALRALQHEARERERDAATAGAALGERQAALAADQGGLDALVARLPVLKKQAATAAALSDKLTAFVSAPPRAVAVVNKPLRIGLWCAALGLAAFVAYSGSNTGAYGASVAIALAGAWVGFKLSIKETFAGHSPDETKAFLDGAAAEWTTVSEVKLPAELEAARAWLAKAGAEAAAEADSLKARANAHADLETGVKAAATNVTELKAAAGAALARAEAWLKERSCATEDEYLQRLTAYEKLSAKAGDIVERLKIFKEKYHCSSDEEIKDRLFLEKEALDAKGVDPAKADEPELERLKARLADRTREARDLENQARDISHAMDKARAVAGARLESLPERINRGETEIAAAREEIAGLELRAEACRLAAEVFGKLAASSKMAFEALAQEVTATLAGAVPGLRAQFGSFDAAEASMIDAGGNLRPVKYLSTGTRDLFMLAARLTMARKARMNPDGKLAPALLVLDEPFYTLDPEREAAALRLLAAFQKETGWQIILLTKDQSVPPKAEEAGLDVTLIKL